MTYIPGNFWRICDRCKKKVRMSNTAREWTGVIVCKSCWEPRHPQDFVKGREEDQSVTDPRPEPADVFITENQNDL